MLSIPSSQIRLFPVLLLLLFTSVAAVRAQGTEPIYPMLSVRQQAEFAIPFSPGDVLVYRVDSAYARHEPYRRFIISTGPGYQYGSPPTRSWFIPWPDHPYVGGCSTLQYHHFALDSSGCVLHTTGLGSPPFQLYPAYLPQNPTVKLNGEEWTVSRVMDTVFLSTTTRAFEIHRQRLRRIITERFGEAAILDDDGKILMELTSAVVRDTAFNRDTTRRLHLPLCVGNQYEYHHVKEEPSIDRLELSTVIGDTIIGGRQFFHIAGMGPLIGWYSCDFTGVYHYRPNDTERYIEGDASLGTLSTFGLVADTATVLPFSNSSSPTFQTYCIHTVTDYYRAQTWLENIGLRKFSSWGFGGGSDEYTLNWARVCGEEYGSMATSVERTMPLQIAAITSISPHPVRSTGTIAFDLASAGHVVVEIQDILGRRVRTLADAEFSAGAQQSVFSTGDLQPGMYFCVLRTDEMTVTGKFIITQ